MITLQDACLELVDCVNRTAPEDPDGAFFAVGTPAMRGNTINLDEARRLDEATFRTWTRRLLPREDDLLLAREAPVGPVVRIPAGGNIAAGQRTTHLRANPEVVDPRFLYFYLTAPDTQRRLLGRAMGSTVPHLRVVDVKAFELVGLPPRLEQQGIAEVLGALDDKIAANRKVTDNEWALARALVNRASRESEATATLDSLSTVITRGVAPKYVDEGGHRVLNQKCVRDGRVLLDPSRRMSALPKDPGKLLQRADVLVNSTGQGTLGRVARWTRDDANVSVDSHVSIVRVDESIADPDFVGVVLCGMENAIEGLAEGSTGQTELRKAQLATLPLALPDRRTQRAVGALARELSAHGDALAAENEALTKTRDELLPLLMSGKITVKDAEKRVEGVV